jgi:hypothetical protein
MRSRIIISLGFVFGLSLAAYVLVWFTSPGQAHFGACTIPSGSYPTIQSAVNDNNCLVIQLGAQSFNENVVINRSVAVNGTTSSTTIINGQNLERVFRVGSGAVVTITSLTVTNGRGGILNQGTVYLENIIIRQNFAPVGAGIFNTGTATIISTTITQNETQGQEERLAGGIYNNGQMYIEQSLIHDNMSDSLGGGLLNNETGNLSILNSVIAENWAGHGGGIFNIGAITITNSTIISNTAGNTEGGGMAQYSGWLVMTNVTLSGNTAGTSGGAIAIFGFGQLRHLSHITIHNNFAQSGGALFLSQPDVQLVNSIIGLNPNAANNCVGTVVSLGSNLDGGTSCGLSQSSDISGLLPFLHPLTTGGWQYTHPPASSSPAVDAAAPSSCPATDQRGFPRPFDGNGNGEARCDIGAHEYDGPPPYYVYLPNVKK